MNEFIESDKNKFLGFFFYYLWFSRERKSYMRAERNAYIL